MNKLFAIIIMCSLSLPVLAIEGQEADLGTSSNNTYEEVQNAVEELNQNVETKTEETILPASKQEINTQYKKPVSKKKLAKKFIIAMLCVVGASVFLYLSLSVYNRIRNIMLGQNSTQQEGETPLDTPVDLTEAIKTFIDKTKWQG